MTRTSTILVRIPGEKSRREMEIFPEVAERAVTLGRIFGEVSADVVGSPGGYQCRVALRPYLKEVISRLKDFSFASPNFPSLEDARANVELGIMCVYMEAMDPEIVWKILETERSGLPAHYLARLQDNRLVKLEF